jgi:hypothetical protein
LNDVNLIEIFGDSIAFKVEDGELKPVHTYSRHLEFIQEVKKCIQKHLDGKPKNNPAERS